jgi:FdhE protein
LKQGELITHGKWTGTPTAGVSAPVPLILPNPATHFAATARRLATLAPGHPAEHWLHFVELLAWAQHEAAIGGDSPGPLSLAAVEQAVEERTPPLSESRGALDPSWQRALQVILDYLRDRPVPGEARSTLEELREAPIAALDALAEAFLEGEVAATQIARTFYVAGSLQVHFTRLAAQLPIDALRLLRER